MVVGPEGFEPSPGGLKVRCAAVDTTVPVAVERVVGLEPTLLTWKDSVLTVRTLYPHGTPTRD